LEGGDFALPPKIDKEKIEEKCMISETEQGKNETKNNNNLNNTNDNSTMIVLWNRSSFFIVDNKNKGIIWFAQRSLPYGTEDGPLELEVATIDEYKEFKQRKKSHHKSRIECKDRLEYVQEFMKWITREERKYGLHVIWILRKKGDMFRSIKLEYLNEGIFKKEMESIGIDLKDVEIWINISLLCAMYPEVNRICNVSKTFYTKNIHAIMKILKSNEKSIQPDPKGLLKYQKYCSQKEIAFKNACSIGGKQGRKIQIIKNKNK